MVAGMGNVLRLDDGFGIAVIELLARGRVPEGVTLMDVGIGGIHLVQELADPYDLLVVVDAADLGRAPGTVLVIRPDVLDVTALPLLERHDELADMHYATPERALMLARAMGVLPDENYMVGCQPQSEELGEGLSEPVQRAVPAAAAAVRQLVSEAGLPWADDD